MQPTDDKTYPESDTDEQLVIDETMQSDTNNTINISEKANH